MSTTNNNNSNNKRKSHYSNNRNNNKRSQQHNWYSKPESIKQQERTEWANNSSRIESIGDNYTIVTNPKFIHYYQSQLIVPAAEWDSFIASLQRKLPTTFRLSTINGLHKRLLTTLIQDEFKLTALSATAAESNNHHQQSLPNNNKLITPPSALCWYPNQLAWSFNCGKSELKSIPALKLFREWLMREFDQGNLNRQEAVSMIPPLLLDVKPHHRVLDICAAPGSKTAQLLESLHTFDSNNDSNTAAEPQQQQHPTGMVIANDSDSKRAYMLVHQLQRLGSPNFLVTTHEGQFFPNLFRIKSNNNTTDNTGTNTNTTSSKANNELIEFDRILADVPCSGDGTLRKNINLWSQWNNNYAGGLHPLQLSIATRCAQMLKIGGLMVYSTCSFNPLENEAVVAELLRRSAGALELVDTNDRLPGLIRSPGLSVWKVLDPNNQTQFIDSYPVNTNTIDDNDSNDNSSKLKSTFFPPTAAESAVFHLERCIRVLPHTQDTGGFFIVLIKKVAPMPNNLQHLSGTNNNKVNTNTNANAAAAAAAAAVNDSPIEENIPFEAESTTTATTTTDAEVDTDIPTDNANPAAADPDNPIIATTNTNTTTNNNNSSTAVISKSFNEDPFLPLLPEVAESIIKFYGLSTDLNVSNFFSRSSVNRKCYFVGSAISEILTNQFNRKRLRIVHSGSRCYEKSNNKPTDKYPLDCAYRIVQEGIDWIYPYITKQLIILSSIELLFTILDKAPVSIQLFKSKLQQNNTTNNNNTATAAAELQCAESILSAKLGCVILVLPQSLIAAVATKSLTICAWKTPNNLSIMIGPSEKKSIYNLLKGINGNSNTSSSVITPAPTSTASANETTNTAEVDADANAGIAF